MLRKMVSLLPVESLNFLIASWKFEFQEWSKNETKTATLTSETRRVQDWITRRCQKWDKIVRVSRLKTENTEKSFFSENDFPTFPNCLKLEQTLYWRRNGPNNNKLTIIASDTSQLDTVNSTHGRLDTGWTRHNDKIFFILTFCHRKIVCTIFTNKKIVIKQMKRFKK